MEHRPLGRTDLRVSSLCLGTMTWGEQNTEAEGHAQMDYAVEHGINFFDTAELYPIPPKAETQGRTEEIIGSWFASRGTREEVVLATKVVGRSDNTWFRDDGSKAELNRRQIEEAVDKSLRRLRTDRIDLYQLHWPDRPTSQFGANGVVYKPLAPAPENGIESILEVLADLVTAGKIRHVGLSNESAWGTMTFLRHAESRGLPRVQSIQNAYSLVNRTFEVALAEVAEREGVGLLAYSPLAQGYLTGKYRGGALPQGSRKQLFNRLGRYETPGAEPAIEAYLDVAEDAGLDPAQMALAFVASRPFVTSAIIGATSLQQLKTDIASLQVRITPDLEERIDAIHLRHCNPCP
jgi:aryl-alcohol dehydrogenase-like predicted oxidoreductase